MVSRYQKQLNTAAEEQAKLMEQSDGQSLHRPSDDPVRYSNWMRYSTEQNENEQYQKNVDAGILDAAHRRRRFGHGGHLQDFEREDDSGGTVAASRYGYGRNCQGYDGKAA